MSFPTVSTNPPNKVVPITTTDTYSLVDVQKDDDLVKTTIQRDKSTNTFFIVTDNIDETNTVNIEENTITDVNGNVIQDTILPEENDIQKVDSSIQNNYAMQFYIGSLTVVGLFVLFRMIQKTR